MNVKTLKEIEKRNAEKIAKWEHQNDQEKDKEKQKEAVA